VKIKLEDLKKAVQWMEANSKDIVIHVSENSDRYLVLKCQDRYDVQVEIKLFNDGTMGPRITKEDSLK
jgi:hypothetical protein